MTITTKITVIKREYENSHGHSPRGKGWWIFASERELPRDESKYIDAPLNTYATARKVAIEWAREQGFATIYVLP